MLIISLILNAVCLYTFTITDIIWILFCNRIIVGVFQVDLFYFIITKLLNISNLFRHTFQFIFLFGVINLE
jgi:hypothetical protein